ncbi:hypothetical protein A9264_05350 [Vibrio sp. UCD-FRSSP16_10]|uniref:DUF1254 domain-containing protein n=1 Tax=unclassified Vibrio TaxID=2614977 RepID=UPI000800062E|nr:MULTISPECIES: DUF1214 domain-containing protein [unclassified Vibrio]OBT07897.1 hypothetical protein A9260_07590 [Vibrio sp. UCD-FRSSP16_30]OBT17073.1 hypothetical protein A9264_05350 [Vibrio sp. UCD-FRSSP16_10]
MNNLLKGLVVATVGFGAVASAVSVASNTETSNSDTLKAGTANAKYQANVPASIITPDHVESEYLGALNYTDGAPSAETTAKANRFVDVSDAVRVFLSGIPVASIQGLLAGHESVGMVPNQTIAISEQMLNAKSLWLTANTTTPYVTSEVDVKNGPVVLEVGTPILGLLDNAAFKFVSRIGVTHPEDQGKGGKYFIYHDSYEGAIPEGMIAVKTSGYQHWLLVRIITTPDNVQADVQKLKQTMKLYPYGEKPNTEFMNISGVEYNTIHAMDESFYDEINTLIQYEPSDIFDGEWLSLAKNIGIEKGKSYEPTEYQQQVFTEAAKIATAEVRSSYYDPQKTQMVYDDRNWFTPLVSGYEFKDSNGVVDSDMRATFHFMATGITPDMVAATPGQGSDYLLATLDSEGQILDGNKHYTVTLPKNVPAAKFWSFMIYDNQTRSMLETDQVTAGVDGLSKGLVKNSDGTITIHFSPVAPQGMQGNWVQTAPNKGFNLIFRMYGPTEAWFDKSWKPSDVTLVK